MLMEIECLPLGNVVPTSCRHFWVSTSGAPPWKFVQFVSLASFLVPSVSRV
jgi:hypothetical protein